MSRNPLRASLVVALSVTTALLAVFTTATAQPTTGGSFAPQRVPSSSSAPNGATPVVTIYFDRVETLNDPRFVGEFFPSRQLSYAKLQRCMSIFRNDKPLEPNMPLISAQIRNDPACVQDSYEADLTLTRQLLPREGGDGRLVTATGGLHLTIYRDGTATIRCRPAPPAPVMMTCTDVTDATVPAPHNLTVRFTLPAPTKMGPFGSS